MIATAEQMGFLLVSSSSIPLCRRVPPIDLAEVEPIEEAVALFYGDEEAYSYHGFEFAQAVLERFPGVELAEPVLQRKNDVRQLQLAVLFWRSACSVG